MNKRIIGISIIVVLVAIALRMAIFANNSQFSTLGIMQNMLVLFLLLPAIFFAIKIERDNHQQKYITFKGALRVGLLVSVLAGIGIGLFLNLYYQYIDTNFVNTLIEKTKVMAAEKQVSEQRLYEVIGKLKEDFNGFRQATKTIMYTLVMGLVYSLISAGFLVRSPEDGNNSSN